MKLDGERFFKRSMVVLLTLRAECSLVTLKPAHLSPYLPSASPRFLSGHTFFTLRLPNPGVVLATSHIRSKIRKETVMKKTISLLI